jgi:hypothetical protein
MRLFGGDLVQRKVTINGKEETVDFKKSKDLIYGDLLFKDVMCLEDPVSKEFVPVPIEMAQIKLIQEAIKCNSARQILDHRVVSKQAVDVVAFDQRYNLGWLAYKKNSKINPELRPYHKTSEDALDRRVAGSFGTGKRR